MGNSTGHATIQAADEIMGLCNKINTLLEFLLTLLKLWYNWPSHTPKEIRTLQYKGKQSEMTRPLPNK